MQALVLVLAQVQVLVQALRPVLASAHLALLREGRHCLVVRWQVSVVAQRTLAEQQGEVEAEGGPVTTKRSQAVPCAMSTTVVLSTGKWLWCLLSLCMQQPTDQPYVFARSLH